MVSSGNVSSKQPNPGLLARLWGTLQKDASAAFGFAESEVTGLVDRLDFQSHGLPKGPFPSLAALQKKFPRAGLPDKIMGTTIDNAALAEPGVTPDSLMAKAAAMGMNTVRLGAYWDEMQPKGPNSTDFKQLDALLAAANKYHLHVILSVGAKGPNWPEYHVPAWAKPASGTDASANAAFAKQSENFVAQVAQHVANNPAIAMWQVENEPFDPAGPTQQVLDTDMVTKEAAILRQSDGHRRPVMINCWSQGDRRSQVDKAFAIADVVGLDVYGHSPGTSGAYERTVGLPAYALSLAKKTGKPAMIAELQADDWGSYQSNPQDIASLTHQLQQMGYQDFLFWRLRQNLEDDAKGNTSLDAAETTLSKQALG